ncbi:signal-transducing adaptor protein 1 [Austrofundulus limnaeus]|uniref:Signal-transducing adaptor protein 1 n=1 Tax=Austrofundulus limnaeus TaxID=52670 RepID=A0A2I4B313_AUSLI|nr:PREDICTED: signal-transducing adaptor protein 1-like [Austrofundulus limnaeus]
MAVPPRVIHKRREAITALPLYYSGYLLKKSSREKNFKDFYGELRGSTLFLYDSDTQETYVERLDLEQMRSMDSNISYKKKEPTILTLNLPSEMVQLKMDSADTGEEWRGYIMTVFKKEIPQRLQLLPGQMMKLEEVLELESKRKLPLSRPPLPPRPNELKPKSATIPTCFFDVSRQEAEKMLEDNPENGSIILRPSALPKNYALTLRQKTSSGVSIKNYRVTATNVGFVIELDTPVTVPSLDDVLKYFLEKTEYRLCPYVISQPYDTRIFTSPPPKCISVSSPSPQTPPRAQVAPMQHLQSPDNFHLRPEKPDEGEYVVPDDRKPYDQMLKKAELDSELREALKKRRDNIYVTYGEDKTQSYEN